MFFDTKLYIVTFLTFITSIFALAQAPVEIPPFLALQQEAMSINNAAYRPDDVKLETFFGYNGFSGIRKNRKTIYALGRFSPEIFGGSSSEHLFGLSIFSEQIGNFISKTRVHLNYSYKISLSGSWKMTAGGALGLFSEQIDQNPTSVQGSDQALDGNLGLSISNGKLIAGLSINQPFQSTIQPFESITELGRYYYIHGEYNFDVANQHLLKAGSIFRYTGTYENTASLWSTFYLYRKFGLGINYFSDRFVILLAMNSFEDNPIAVQISLDTSIRSEQNLGSEGFQIQLSYKIHSSGHQKE